MKLFKNKFINYVYKIKLLLLFVFIPTILLASAKPAFWYKTKYIYNPLNIKLDFEQIKDKIIIKNKDKFGILQIPNDYYLIFEIDTSEDRDPDFVLKHNELQKYFYSTASKELHEKKIFSKNLNLIFKKKKNLVSINQINQSTNLKFLNDRFSIFESANYFEVFNKLGDEEFYCYKFFFKNLSIDRSNIKQLIFAPKHGIDKLLITFRIGNANYQAVIDSNTKNEFLFDVANQPKFETWKKIKIKSIKFFSNTRLFLNNSDELLTYYGRENVRHNIDMLLRTHSSTYFAIPINQKIFKLRTQSLLSSDNIEIKNIFVGSLSKVKLLDKELDYYMDNKSRYFLKKKLSHNFYIDNKTRRKFRKIDNISFYLKKNTINYLKINYGNTYENDSSLDLRIVGKNNEEKIFYNIVPNTYLKLNFDKDFIIEKIELTNIKSLKLKYFDTLNIFEEKIYISKADNISTFDFPALMSSLPKYFDLQDVSINQDFIDYYRQNNLIYKFEIKEKKEKYIINLNDFFINKKDHIDILYLWIENKKKNINNFLTKYKNECLVKLKIKFESREEIQCFNKNLLSIDFSELEKHRVRAIQLIIDNTYNILNETLYLSGINVFNEDLNLDKIKLQSLLKSTFKKDDKNLKKFLNEYFFIHRAPIHINNLLQF